MPRREPETRLAHKRRPTVLYARGTGHHGQRIRATLCSRFNSGRHDRNCAPLCTIGHPRGISGKSSMQSLPSSDFTWNNRAFASLASASLNRNVLICRETIFKWRTCIALVVLDMQNYWFQRSNIVESNTFYYFIVICSATYRYVSLQIVTIDSIPANMKIIYTSGLYTYNVNIVARARALFRYVLEFRSAARKVTRENIRVH